ncbi:MAG: type II secretion system inner membrane protein GspF [Pseudomonadota bacterium]|nr:type II secretion system inner membrane protein GspF [Pseudomonadota bacterium]
MGAFEYTALDASGKERRGVLEGDTARHVRNQLRDQRLLPVTVNEVQEKESRANRGYSFSFGTGVSATDLSLLTRQLATLVRAGLPLEEALLAVSQQSEKPRVQRILIGVRAKVMEGHPLAAGLGEFPRVFPEIFRATVAAGEQAGHLDEVLERLADYTENREVLRQKVIGAMLYPIVLTVLCFGIVSILLVFVVPKVTEVFDSYRAQLPLITRVLILLSNIFREWGVWILVGLVALGWLVSRQLKKPAVRLKVDRFQLKLPIFGRVVRGFNTARFTRTLSILTSSSVPVLEALRIAGSVINNLPMREAVATATLRVREGAPIGRSLAVGKLFPPMTIHLISSGESSGELDTMLERSAQSQERELDGLLTALTGLLGPLLIILMGVFVIGIVFAMLMPIFQMNSLIR